MTPHPNPIGRLGDSRFAVRAFFALLLLAGLWSFPRAGVSWDEEYSRIFIGRVNWNYILHGEKTPLVNGIEKYHGPALELLLSGVEKAFGMTDTRGIYVMRHGLTFAAFFCAVFCFYRLARMRFENRWIALSGCAFLALSPRIFANASYNLKDLGFMSFFLVSLYTQARFLERPGRGRAAWHGLATGFMIAIRVMGVMIPLITLTLILARIAADGGERRKLARAGLIYAAVSAGATILFWPVLWDGPVKHLVAAFLESSRFTIWSGSLLYLGRVVKGSELPWHYIPICIGVTTPPLYLALFAIGAPRALYAALSRPGASWRTGANDLIQLACCFGPVIAVIAFKSVLYDLWRHLFFIYPSLLMLGLVGLEWMWNEVLPRLAGTAVARVRALFAGAVAAGLLITLGGMIRHAPHQYVYFNLLAGPSRDWDGRFQMDYWGLSYREGLDAALGRSAAPLVRVHVPAYPGKLNWLLLTPEQKRRVRYVPYPQDADFVVSNIRGYAVNLPGMTLVHQLKYRDAEVMSVLQNESAPVPSADTPGMMEMTEAYLVSPEINAPPPPRDQLARAARSASATAAAPESTPTPAPPHASAPEPAAMLRATVFPPLATGERLDFAASAVEPHLVSFSGVENGHRWTLGRHAEFAFTAPACGRCALRVYAAPFLAPGHLDAQRLLASVNGEAAAEFTLRESDARLLEFPLPPLKPGAKVAIGFDLPDAQSLNALGFGGDTRLLGFGVNWIELSPETDPAPAVR